MESAGWTCPFFPNWTLFILFIVFAVVWEGVWKAIGLWRSARNNHLAWFICIIIFNTLGILPIVYIFGFSKRGEKSAAE